MPIQYTKKMLIERIKRHLNNGFPDQEFGVSDNEMLLYIDQALATSIIGKAYETAKIEGALAVPDAFYITSQLASPTKNSVTDNWESKLPQPPISLPLGYSISRVYFGGEASGMSEDAYPVEAKRAAYRNLLPKPSGILYTVEGDKIIFMPTNGQSLLNQTPFVSMASSRTNDPNDTMALPDDAIDGIMKEVVGMVTNRRTQQKDIVKDDQPAGNNNIKS